MDLAGKRVLVVGAGKSGLAAVRKLLSMKAEVFLTDKQSLSKLQGVKELALSAQQLILGQEPDLDHLQPDLIVLSPGVSPELPFIQKALKQKLPVWSEVELALRATPATVVGVTGSNGKTTTTTLLGVLAQATGKKTIVAGNIGTALSGLVDNLNQGDIIVAELSSFQLELIQKTRINIAIFLNLTPDHLDRHGTLENYAEAKAKIFKNQTEQDLAVLNWDDPYVRGLANRTKARVVYFSRTELLSSGICLDSDYIVIRDEGSSTPLVKTSELLLRGSHNLENVMAATAAALRLGLKPSQIRELLKNFKPVAHRQEIVGLFNNILYINDSKATNPDSAIKALESYSEPIVLLAGGKNKGLDLTKFLHVAKQKAKSLVLVGEAAGELETIAAKIGMERVLRSESFEDAVQKAIAEAEPGDVVLLSPACTSWDMFTSYEERGELFKELVRKHYREP